MLALGALCALAFGALGFWYAASHADTFFARAAAARPMTIKLRRVCERCPNYTITLTGDGTLTYQGGEYAAVRGTRQFRLEPAEVTAVMLDFIQPEFLELESTYPTQGVERMTITLSIEMNGLSKAVLSEDSYGPTILQKLAAHMDDLPGMRALSGWPF